MDKKVKYNVDKFYYENHRVSKNGTETGLNIYEKNNGRLEGGRQHDPIYNNENVRRQIYTFGCSWTYGWDLEQEQTFTHLLGDENTSVHNYGAGGSGLDFAVKTLSEVYIPESRRQIFIITIPHYFRRTWFDDNGVVMKPWQVKEKTNINEYNSYFNFLHNYELLNTFVGRDKIIWGTWDGDLPEDMFDVFFERVDYTNDGLHPGPKAHKQYAEKIKDVLQDRFK
tara:strand:+ start:153 stop:827 length:675 start_codon:yes stop_codon:yes gene_type:complete